MESTTKTGTKKENLNVFANVFQYVICTLCTVILFISILSIFIRFLLKIYNLYELGIYRNNWKRHHFLLNVFSINFICSLQKVFNTQFMRVELTYGLSSKYLIKEKLLLYFAVFIISEFVWVNYSNASFC